jgi:16S rRNA (uracil1498-N3)-methyltransferase
MQGARTTAPYNRCPVHRFFAPALDPGDEAVVLPRGEAEHLTRVLRLTAGDIVAVFDGRGNEFLGRVIGAGGRDVRVVIVERREPAKEAAVAITLAQAVLKSDKMDDVVRDAVMLGVTAIQPLVTARSETTIAALMRGARLERWRRVALASVKQSGRAVVPPICQPLSLEAYLAESRPAVSLMLVEPGAGADPETLAALRSEPTPSEAVLAVGPEGGWRDDEWQAARAGGMRLVSLGHRTLRADAVSVAAVSILHFLWELPDQKPSAAERNG